MGFDTQDLSKKLDLTSTLKTCLKSNNDELILEQVKKNGMGSELYLEALEHNNSIRL